MKERLTIAWFAFWVAFGGICLMEILYVLRSIAESLASIAKGM